MPRLKIEIGEDQLKDDQIRQGLSELVSDNDAFKLVQAMGHLMRSQDLGFWLSPRLMRKLRIFATEQRGEISEVTGEVYDRLFLLWLRQGGSIEPNVKWEVESLPNNGGIYRIIMEGGSNEKSFHNSQSK